MKEVLVAFGSGLLFGIGLLVSGMAQPAKVVGFLDLLGGWDPSLAFVMIGAIGVHLVAYRLVPSWGKPLLAPSFGIPTRRDLDPRLVVGAAMFGAGWGLAGYCPGPALVSVATGASSALVFGGAMLVGMAAYTLWESTMEAK